MNIYALRDQSISEKMESIKNYRKNMIFNN